MRSEICLQGKFFSPFSRFLILKGRQTLFQLVLWMEVELRSICLREGISHRVKVRLLSQRLWDFYQLTDGGKATCGVAACTDLHAPPSL